MVVTHLANREKIEPKQKLIFVEKYIAGVIGNVCMTKRDNTPSLTSKRDTLPTPPPPPPPPTTTTTKTALNECQSLHDSYL